MKGATVSGLVRAAFPFRRQIPSVLFFDNHHNPQSYLVHPSTTLQVGEDPSHILFHHLPSLRYRVAFIRPGISRVRPGSGRAAATLKSHAILSQNPHIDSKTTNGPVYSPRIPHLPSKSLLPISQAITPRSSLPHRQPRPCCYDLNHPSRLISYQSHLAIQQ